MIVGVLQVAAGIKAALDPHFGIVYRLPPAQTEASSATVVPTGGSPESRSAAALKFDVVLVANLADFEAALAWLADGIGLVSDALTADPTCGGTCTGIRVASWGEFYLATIGGGADALAVRITLSETNPTE